MGFRASRRNPCGTGFRQESIKNSMMHFQLGVGFLGVPHSSCSGKSPPRNRWRRVHSLDTSSAWNAQQESKLLLVIPAVRQKAPEQVPHGKVARSRPGTVQWPCNRGVRWVRLRQQPVWVLVGNIVENIERKLLMATLFYCQRVEEERTGHQKTTTNRVRVDRHPCPATKSMPRFHARG